MLLQFAVENYGCFADRVVLSFVAVPGETHPEGQVIEVPGVGPVLRSVILYGANAAGKSTVGRALFVLCQLAVGGVRPGEMIRVHPHRLDTATRAGPTGFQVDFVADGVRWAYGLEVDRQRVVSEWLDRDQAGTSERVFEREGPITLGPAFERISQRREFYRFVAEGTRPEQPFLAELHERHATELASVFTFFQRATLSASELRASPTAVLASLPDLLPLVGKLLSGAGTGIESVTLQSRDPEVHRQLGQGEPIPFARAAELEARGDLFVMFNHRDAQHGLTPLSILEVSDGTRRLFELSAFWLTAPAASLVVIDELDRSFHAALPESWSTCSTAAAGPPSSCSPPTTRRSSTPGCSAGTRSGSSRRTTWARPACTASWSSIARSSMPCRADSTWATCRDGSGRSPPPPVRSTSQAAPSEAHGTVAAHHLRPRRAPVRARRRRSGRRAMVLRWPRAPRADPPHARQDRGPPARRGPVFTEHAAARLAAFESSHVGVLIPQDERWLVLDVDRWHNLNEVLADAEQRGWRFAISNPCFEVWLQLHFADSAQGPSSQECKTRWRQLRNEHPEEWPFERAHIEAACARAAGHSTAEGWIPPPPGTTVHRLVGALPAA